MQEQIHSCESHPFQEKVWYDFCEAGLNLTLAQMLGLEIFEHRFDRFKLFAEHFVALQLEPRVVELGRRLIMDGSGGAWADWVAQAHLTQLRVKGETTRSSLGVDIVMLTEGGLAVPDHFLE